MSFAQAQDVPPPIKVLLVIGGGYHDYEAQKEIISRGLEARANINVTISFTKTEFKQDLVSTFDGYTSENWADGYDVVIHNICSARSPAEQFVDRVAKVHEQGKPAVFLHCSLFNYRDIERDEWFKLIGLSACPVHEKHHEIIAGNNASNHPLMKGFPPLWKTPNGELYKICKIWEKTKVLSWGMASEKIAHPVVWTNKYGNAKVFGTSIGHHNETVDTSVYLDLLARGVLWSVDKLDSNGEPLEGYGLFEKMTLGTN